MWSVQWRFALVLSLALGCGFTDKPKVPAPDGVAFDPDGGSSPADGAVDGGSTDGAPPGWECFFDEWYGDGTCHCGCGIPDPDCGGSGCAEVDCCDAADSRRCSEIGCESCAGPPCN